MDLINASAALPEAVLLPLAVWFFGAACFYLYRGLFPEAVKSVYGYSDLENEVGHGLCALAMVPMLAPMLLPIPNLVWTILLGLGCAYFTARALTWGKRVSYATKWWWDWAHVGMLGGMAVMYAGITFAPLTALLSLFWLWLLGYYLYELSHDLKSRNIFYIGSDLTHATMGGVMFVMSVAPSLFMSHMSM